MLCYLYNNISDIMNIRKYIRPNLLDPMLERRIIKTLNPAKPDYWAPTKNVAKNFFQNFVKQNIWLIIFIVIIILFLIYRYRVIKKNRELIVTNQPDIKSNNYSTMIMEAYNIQKERLREPKIEQNPPNNNFAYPMYPYK